MSVPAGGLLLTAGVDVQQDRLAVVVIAWGRGEESWLVLWAEIYGDTGYTGGGEVPEVWRQLQDVLARGYPHAGVGGAGVTDLHVVSAAVDSGYRTQDVYAFCRGRGPRFFATKGANSAGRPVITRPSTQDVTAGGHLIKGGVALWSIGTDMAKRQIYGRLKIASPGAGYMHFPIGLGDEFYEQLCAEKLVTKYRHGVPYQEWHQTRPRNEALDCYVLAYAAAIRAGMGRVSWDRLERQRGAESNAIPPTGELAALKPQRAGGPRRDGGAFINRY